MKALDCEIVKDLLPEWAAKRLEPDDLAGVQAHLAECPDCRGESSLVLELRKARPVPPADLEGRIRDRIREAMEQEREGAGAGSNPDSVTVIPLRPRRRWALRWALSAAALVILALGTRQVWRDRMGDPAGDPLVVASQEPLPESWLWDDGLVAGALVFDGLSDEELAALVEELEG